MCARRTSEAARCLYVLFCTLILSLFIGCDTIPLSGVDSASLHPDFADWNMPPVQNPVYEDPGDKNTFDTAQPATLPIQGEIVIHGNIDHDGDIDFYALGPAIPGDLVVIDVTGHDGLNTVAALYDGNGDLIKANNDRSFYAGQHDPYIARVVRQNTPMLFVGIAVSTATHFATSTGRYPTGSYSIRISRRPGESFLPPRQQVVWLDFAGGDHVQIALEPVEIMRPFSAEAISSRFTGQTDYMIDLIISHLRRDVAPFNVVLLESRNDVRPSGLYSRLYFGNYNAAYLGLADSVDTGNQRLDQKAIIFTEDMSMFEGLLPSAEAVALAIANVAAHELGHLLGLEHSSEPEDVMATAASARQLLEIDATYKRSRLQRHVFPVGWQDGYGQLVLNLGPNPFGATARAIDFAPSNIVPIDPALGDIPINMCGSCTNHCAAPPEDPEIN